MNSHDTLVIIGCALWTVWWFAFGWFGGLSKGRGEARKHTGFHIHKVEYPPDDADWWKKQDQ